MKPVALAGLIVAIIMRIGRHQRLSKREESNDGSGVALVLKSMLQEFERANAKADRHYPEQKANQEGIARWAKIYTIITGIILTAAGWQSVSVQRQLNVAIASNRAWVSLDPKLISRIHFDPYGGHFDLSVTVKNPGHSPATDISIDANGGILVPGRDYDVKAILSSVCDNAARNVISQVTIFPGEEYTIFLPVGIKEKDIQEGIIPERGERPDSIIPLVYVCVVYNDAGEGGKSKRTAFSYTIGTQVENPRELKNILPRGDEALQDPLVLRRDFLSGSFAE